VYAAIRPDEHNHKHRRLQRAAGPPPFHPQGGLLSLDPFPLTNPPFPLPFSFHFSPVPLAQR